MKRFVTYLYECERGNKTKNVGFIRVNVRNEEMTIEVYIRNLSRSNGRGKIYFLICKENLRRFALGEFEVKDGKSDSCFSAQADDIMQSDFSVNNIEGIGIWIDSGVYIASCWKDEHADEIVRGEFEEGTSSVDDGYTEGSMSEEVIEDELAVAEETETLGFINVKEEMIQESSHIDCCTTYEKIELTQIRNLPSPNWHLATNSFLVHGVTNYGYLVLKKDMEADKEALSLGVPGVFEIQEAIMAIFFGFPAFEEVPEAVVSAEMNQSIHFSGIKENQEPKTGAFGSWFVRLKE